MADNTYPFTGMTPDEIRAEQDRQVEESKQAFFRTQDYLMGRTGQGVPRTYGQTSFNSDRSDPQGRE